MQIYCETAYNVNSLSLNFGSFVRKNIIVSYIHVHVHVHVHFTLTLLTHTLTHAHTIDERRDRKRQRFSDRIQHAGWSGAEDKEAVPARSGARSQGSGEAEQSFS